MRSSVLRVALPAILALLVGCGVTDADIDHWKRTQRGPNKITAVLIGTKYTRPLRVHAARALIEMRHPNANGLELLTQAMAAMPPADREGIIHDLLDSLRNQMRGAEQQQTAAGPAEPQIRAKDAAYLLLRFASPSDRQELSTELLNWILTDLNTRALAGQYTAEQVVTAVGPMASDRLAQSYTSNEDSIRVAINVSQLINSVASDSGKDTAVGRLLVVARDISGSGSDARLRTTANALLARSLPPGTAIAPERVVRATDQLRGQYLNILFEAIRMLNRPMGTEYLISVASDNAQPIERRKAVLSGVSGQVRPSDAPALIALASSTHPSVDLELRGVAVDRLGETRSPTVLTQLWTIFDSTNGGEANNEFTLRWKAGESILKIGGPAIIPTFITHMTAARSAAARGPAPAVAFEGFTLAEINGYALTIGDYSPPPRDVMRGLLTHPMPHVKALALAFLGEKGEAPDAARIAAFLADTTAMTGAGWAPANAATLGGAAARARDRLRRALGQPPLPVATPPATAPAAAPAAAPAH